METAKIEPPKPNAGIYYDLLQRVAPANPSRSFLAKDWDDARSWREDTRQTVRNLLEFGQNRDLPFNARVESSTDKDGLKVEEISYDMPYGPRTHGYFLRPADKKEKLPGIVALHDHGGFFYFGKEKIVDDGTRSRVLKDFKSFDYRGTSWATALAKQGYAVLAIDVFMFGSRKVPVESVNPAFVKQFQGLKEGSDEYVRAYNQFMDAGEGQVLLNSLLHADACWPGVFSYEDGRSVDYLLTRPEVDKDRIGCGGLSLGGLRTVFLAGLDPRIKAAVCVGYMCTTRSQLRNHLPGLNQYVPNLADLLDLPDLISLHAPSPLMVQYLTHDGLYTIEGQRTAHETISQVYSKMGQSENYVGEFYPGQHRFDGGMQATAFKWLDAVL